MLTVGSSLCLHWYTWGGNPVHFAAAGVAARQRGTVIKRQFRVVFSIVSGGGRCIVV